MQKMKDDIVQAGQAALVSEHDFALFFKEWHPAVLYFVLGLVKEKTVAEDITQDAFVTIWERRYYLINGKVARAFLYTTARNAAFNWLRSKQVVEKNQKQLRYLQESSEKSQFENMIAAELIHELQASLYQLPPKCGLVLHRRYIDGKKNPELARELKLSINTVQSHRARGLSILRKKLSGFF